MGGDKGPSSFVLGAKLALEAYSELCDLNFIFHGDLPLIRSMLDKDPALSSVSSVVSSSDDVSQSDRPSHAVRRKRTSSMYNSLNSVSQGLSDGVVSCGNTGALVAISRILLKNIRGVNKSALCSIIPGLNGDFLFLDIGAHISCDAEALVQFAFMGSEFAKVMLTKDMPCVGLLNIGSEDVKGNDTIKLAASRLKDLSDSINFKGYIEPHSMWDSGVDIDVVVTDGFSGNIALKAAEGFLKFFIMSLYSSAKKTSLFYKILFKLLKPFFVSHSTDFHTSGAVLLGLNGVVVKGHGSSNEHSICGAIGVALNIILGDINNKVSEGLEDMLSVSDDKI